MHLRTAIQTNRMRRSRGEKMHFNFKSSSNWLNQNSCF